MSCLMTTPLLSSASSAHIKDTYRRTAACRGDCLPSHCLKQALGRPVLLGQRLARPFGGLACAPRTRMFPYPILTSNGPPQQPLAPCRGTSPSVSEASTDSQSHSSTAGPPATTNFDLSLAVALAAAAFEAYLEPSGADGFQERTLNGTEVSYTDRRFLQDQFEGVLQLHIKSAKGLKAVNFTSRDSDPFVVASVGDNCATTSVKWGTVEPIWDETHTLYVTSRETESMRIRVFDKGGAILNMQSDKDLGVVMVPLRLLEDGKEMELQLRGPDARGSITISTTFLPFSGTEEGKAALEAATNTTDLVLPGASATAAVVATAMEEGLPEGSPEEIEQQATEAVQEAVQTAVQLLPKDAQLDPAKLQKALHVASGAAFESAAAYAERVSQQLAEAGVDAKTIDSIMEQAREAAQGVQRFVSGSALGSVPISQLKRLLASIGSSKRDEAAGGDSKGSNGSNGNSSSSVSSSREAGEGSKGADAAAQQQEQQGQQGAEGELQQDTALSKLEQAHLPGAWKALAGIAGRVIDESLVPIAFVENRETDTQVWVYRNEEQREVVVAFRGTEQVKWKDFISDLNFIPTSLDAERTGISSVLPFASFKTNKDIMVHSGFLNAYDSVRTKLLKLVDDLTPPPPGSSDKDSSNDSASSSSDGPGDTHGSNDGNSRDGSKQASTSGSDGSASSAGLGSREWFSKWWNSKLGGGQHKEQQPWRVYVTGHSLGGALATLCAYELAGRRKPHHQVAMYTYGAPRVGNTAFSQAFNERVPGSWRFYNASDIVPSVPRLMGYSHVKNGVRLTGSGGLEFEESSKDVLGEGREISDVLQELADKAVGVAQGRHTFEDVMDELKEHEMEIFFALVDGSALAQHMEDYYLQTLKECVLLADPSLKEQFEEAIAEVVASTSSEKAAPEGKEKPAADAQPKEE